MTTQKFSFSECEQREARVVFLPTADSERDHLTHDERPQPFEVPIVDEGVKTYVEQDGIAGVNRETEVYYPIEWNGQNIHQYIDEQSKGETHLAAKVQYERPDYDPDGNSPRWRTAHIGFVRRVGKAAETGKMRLWIDDYSEIVNGLRVDYTFDSSLHNLQDIFNDAVEELKNTQYFGSGAVPLTASQIVYQYTDFDDFEDGYWDMLTEDIWNYGDIGDDTKEWTSNKNTLTDVLDWACERTDGMWSIEWDDENETAVLSYNRTSSVDGIDRVKFASGENLQENERYIDVIKNDALYDINPRNTLSAVGEETSEGYPYATIQHVNLYEAAGKQSLNPDTKEVDETSLEDTENAARRLLKEELAEATGGEMSLYGAPDVVPNAQVRAAPECEDILGQGGYVENTSTDGTSSDTLSLDLSSQNKEIKPVETAETHAEFYEYWNDRAHHDYISNQATNILLHRNTNTGSVALIVTHHDASQNKDYEYTVKTEFGSLVDEKDFVVEDESGDGNEYTDEYVGHGFYGNETDGFALEIGQMDDWYIPSITITNNYTHSNLDSGNTDISSVLFWTGSDSYKEYNPGDTIDFTGSLLKSKISDFIIGGGNQIERLDTDGETKWSATVQNFKSLDYNDNYVIVGGGNGSDYSIVKCLDIEDGSELWTQFFYPPDSAYTDNRIIDITILGPYVFARQTATDDSGGFVGRYFDTHKLYIEDGTEWTDADGNTVGDKPYGSMEFDGDSLYAADPAYEHWLRLDENLNADWSYDTYNDTDYGASHSQAVCLGDDKVVFLNNQDEQVECRRKSDGQMLWENDSGGGLYNSHIAIIRHTAEGMAYVLTGRYIYEIDASTGDTTNKHSHGVSDPNTIYYHPDNDHLFVADSSSNVIEYDRSISKVATHSISFSSTVFAGDGWAYHQRDTSSSSTDGSTSELGDVSSLAHWPMDYINTDRIRDIERTNHGEILTDSAQYDTTGIYESCLNFDSIHGDAAKLDGTGVMSELYNSEGTLGFWFRLDELTNNAPAPILHKGWVEGDSNAWLFYLDSDGYLNFRYRSNDRELSETITSVSAGDWTYFAVTNKDNGDLKAWYGVDGVHSSLTKYDLGDLGSSHSAFSNSSDVKIGYWGGDYPFTATDTDFSLDEVRAYSNTLNADQLNKLFTNPSAKLEDKNAGTFNKLLYQVNTVVHHAPATGHYKTSINVAPLTSDLDIFTLERTYLDSL